MPKGNSLAANSTMERTAKPGEGQNDGQETAAIHGGLQVSTIAHPQKSTSCSDRDRPPRSRSEHNASVWVYLIFPVSWSGYWGQP